MGKMVETEAKGSQASSQIWTGCNKDLQSPYPLIDLSHRAAFPLFPFPRFYNAWSQETAIDEDVAKEDMQLVGVTGEDAEDIVRR